MRRKREGRTTGERTALAGAVLAVFTSYGVADSLSPAQFERSRGSPVGSCAASNNCLRISGYIAASAEATSDFRSGRSLSLKAPPPVLHGALEAAPADPDSVFLPEGRIEAR